MRLPILKIFTLFAYFIYASSCIASTSDLVEDANNLCTKISQEGISKNYEFKGLARIELKKIFKKLGAEVEGKGKFQQKEFSGVFQEDLARAIEKSDNCRLEAFKMLKDLKIATLEKSNKKLSKRHKPNSIVGDWYLDKAFFNGKNVTEDASEKFSKNEPFITFLKNGKVELLTMTAYAIDDGEVVEIRGKAAIEGMEMFYSIGENLIQINIPNIKENENTTPPIEIKYKLNGDKLRLTLPEGRGEWELIRY